MFKFFMLIIFFSLNSLSSWKDISYEKRFDELSWTEILKVLEAENKLKIIEGVIQEHFSEISKEDYQYYFLLTKNWNASETTLFMNKHASASSRESALRFLIYSSRNDVKNALPQILLIKNHDLTVKIVENLIQFEFWSLAEEKFKLLLYNPNIYTFQIIQLLEKVKLKSDFYFHRYLQFIRIVRPEEELTQQIWIEKSFSVYPFESWQSLNRYCIQEKKYCYNSIEIGKSLGFYQGTLNSFLHLNLPLEIVKTQLHRFIDEQNYVGILQMRAELDFHHLLEEDRYRYSYVYAAFVLSSCKVMKESFGNLLDKNNYRSKLETLMKKCNE